MLKQFFEQVRVKFSLVTTLSILTIGIFKLIENELNKLSKMSEQTAKNGKKYKPCLFARNFNEAFLNMLKSEPPVFADFLKTFGLLELYNDYMNEPLKEKKSEFKKRYYAVLEKIANDNGIFTGFAGRCYIYSLTPIQQTSAKIDLNIFDDVEVEVKTAVKTKIKKPIPTL